MGVELGDFKFVMLIVVVLCMVLFMFFNVWVSVVIVIGCFYVVRMCVVFRWIFGEGFCVSSVIILGRVLVFFLFVSWRRVMWWVVVFVLCRCVRRVVVIVILM